MPKAICVVKPLNTVNKSARYLFAYDFDCVPYKGQVVHCDTRIGGMYGEIVEIAIMPKDEYEQNCLLTLIQAMNTKVSLPLKKVDKVYMCVGGNDK